ncbi:MAG: hypothetical protein ABIQ17_01650, partial [Candidatus Limnocylindrales bacterium]
MSVGPRSWRDTPLEERWGLRVLANRRVRAILPWAGVLVLAIWTLKPPFWGSDAFAYWFNAGALWRGEPIYHATTTHGGLGYYFYPPPVAQILAPTSFLPFQVWV